MLKILIYNNLSFFSRTLAIGFAKENNNINLIVKSLFIKIKAIERLGDYVQALPLILLFKHLKPDVSYHNEIEAMVIVLSDQKRIRLLCRSPRQGAGGWL